MKHLVRTLWVVALSLAACSSGGGGKPASGTLPLTALNAEAAVISILEGAPELEGIGEGLFTLFDELDLSEEGVFECPNDGTYGLELHGNPPTAGTITFTDCVFDFGDGPTTLNGTLTFRLASADTVAFTLDLRAVDSQGTTDILGDMSVELGSAGSSTLVMIVRGKSLQISEDGFSYALEDFRLEERVNVSNGDWTATMRGYMREDSFGGTIYFATTTPLAGSGDDHPESGVLILRGAGGSRIRITLSGENILIELDADGDGVYEDSETTTWSELD
ncbi:MAG: hypothetical protein ACYTGZ_22830 [Planctomycetota bacterium]|jgi:hypothetical protein